ncbi:MAG: DoxX family membrane protein [Planctomycetota bacterium]
MGVVFLIFAIGKFQNDIWAQTMRNMTFFQSLPWNPDISVIVVGILEVVVAAGLICGLFTRLFSAAAALQLLAILILLKFQPIRDIGLLGMAIYMAFAGHDFAGLGQLLRRNRKKETG